MSRVKEIDPTNAVGETKALFDRFQEGLGRVPSMVRLMAHSPAMLEAYLHFNHALERTTLTTRMRALVSMTVAELNGCAYTLAVAAAIGRRNGVAEAELEAARHGLANDSKTSDGLAFATSIVRSNGRVPLAEVERLQRRGFTDEEIVDLVGVVGFNLFRNYFNLVLDTTIDAPLVRTPRTEGAPAPAER